MDNFLIKPFNNTENADDDEDDKDDEQSRTLFCSNLDERVTDEILHEVFLQAGPIESARIPLDNAGRQRNFGFVTYQHKSAVPYAVELYQGLELYQKKVAIRQQCPDKPKTPAAGPARVHNPSSVDGHHGLNGRHGLHGSKQFDRNSGVHNRYNYNNEGRWPRSSHRQQQHNNSGGNRRSDQLCNSYQGKRRWL